MEHYDFRAIEQKWQRHWAEHSTFKTQVRGDQPKYYVLDMFPYPSGAGLHVGHLLGYVASDVIARYKRAQGYNVLHPMGFDAFGLPAEQYALQTGQHPGTTTVQNMQHYTAQMQRLGLAIDWDRGFHTSDPAYYRWTQWIFIQLFHSWYDTRLQKARPIKALVTQLAQAGNSNVEAACDTDTPTVTAEVWQQMTEQEQQALLLKYRLAFLEETTVNWCPELSTVLANEEVKGGLSERGGYPVVSKKMQQWSLRITAYATRLLEDLSTLDWPTSVKEMQRHWIGMSRGAMIVFEAKTAADTLHAVEIFTSRPETIFGVTYLVLAPEHSLVQPLTTATQQSAVNDYVSQAKNRSERERLADVKRVTGVFTGNYARHPFSGQLLPIWVSDYVLAGYGSGAVMGVPAHDSRDHAFAQHFDLPIIRVITTKDTAPGDHEQGEEKLINASFLNGLTLREAREAILTKLIEHQIGRPTTTLRLRNAVFSRQRYWGEPFPIYYKDGMPYSLPDNALPLKLPNIKTYQPTATGNPPLGHADHWHTSAGYPLELSTMPGWASSSWYCFRYMDPHNENHFVSPSAQSYWQAVDLYMGGAEHATGHLLYARFWTKFLYDLGYVNTKEPFQKLINQGMIQAPSCFVYRVKGTQQFVSRGYRHKYDTVPMRVLVDLVKDDVLDIEEFRRWRPGLEKATFILEEGKYFCGREIEKMSKSKYNVVNPDVLTAQYGADTLRIHTLFLGPLEQSKLWNIHGIEGAFRFLSRLWRLFEDATEQVVVKDTAPPTEVLRILHRTIKKMQDAIEQCTFNTAISALMICVKELTMLPCRYRIVLKNLLVLLAPFAPHIAEELWQRLGHDTSITTVPWPRWDAQYLVEHSFEYPIAINGKVRAHMLFGVETAWQEIEKRVLANTSIQKWTQGRAPKKVIVVPQRIVNIVV